MFICEGCVAWSAAKDSLTQQFVLLLIANMYISVDVDSAKDIIALVNHRKCRERRRQCGKAYEQNSRKQERFAKRRLIQNSFVLVS